MIDRVKQIDFLLISNEAQKEHYLEKIKICDKTNKKLRSEKATLTGSYEKRAE